MSVRDEREPLAPRTTSLYDYALFRHGIEPDGRVPRRGYPLPEGSPPEHGRPDHPRRTWEQTQAEVSAALTPCSPTPTPYGPPTPSTGGPPDCTCPTAPSAHTPHGSA